MIYTLNESLNGQTMDNFLKVIYILLGMLIGASIGLYVAVKTIPLSPPIQYYYLQGKP
jgi:hypothetical protein